jgi:hypothetical protein
MIEVGFRWNVAEHLRMSTIESRPPLALLMVMD